MTISPFLAAATLSALLLAGCQSRSRSSFSQATKYSVENTGKFALLDQAAQTAITCTGLQERPTTDGRLEVVANVKNHTNAGVQVRVRCVFKNASGFTTGDETPWQTLSLDDGDTQAVAFTSANTLARKYTIIVRGAP